MPVPWGQIIQWAPQIIGVSRDLLQRARRGAPPESSLASTRPPDELAVRVAALEDNERRQAELIDQMARQQAQLSQAVLVLRRHLRVLGVAMIVLCGLLAWRLLA
ncbi:MAG: hypothetical protein IT480_02250 [Gammaproteobacteria bacterium]|nr:hypothetical protein [Gammaproteobacteria bacterium]